MPTVLDIIRHKRITNFVWRDVRKVDGTALHVWKKRSKRVLHKKTQILNGVEIPLIDFPDYYANTISSIIAYHFVRKEKKSRKQLLTENAKMPGALTDQSGMQLFESNNKNRYTDFDESQKRRKKKRRIVVKKKMVDNQPNHYYKTPLGINRS
ncbi:hypothetical protein [uncultured Microscilla sp.]|uniref:hypothetical protein n=1 Tax=uncultured Microscilla sp. TaxID=432653 RepID=UPI0026315F85|nr:hypothetical protein [uncultured Microscilla sp.]